MLSSKIKVDKEFTSTAVLISLINSVGRGNGQTTMQNYPTVVRSMDFLQANQTRFAVLGLSEDFKVWLNLTERETKEPLMATNINETHWMNRTLEPEQYVFTATLSGTRGTWFRSTALLVPTMVSNLMSKQEDPLFFLKRQKEEGMILKIDQNTWSGDHNDDFNVPGAKAKIEVEDKYHYVSMLNQPFVMDMPCELHASADGESFVLPKGRSFIEPDVFFAMTIQWPETDNRLNLISNVGQANKQVRHGDSFFGRL